MEVLRHFPRQVLFLIGTTRVCALSGNPSGLTDRMIDTKTSGGFERFVRYLDLARNGDATVQRSIFEYGTAASAHLATMLSPAVSSEEYFRRFSKDFSYAELQQLRAGGPLPWEFLDRLVTVVIQISKVLFVEHPATTQKPPFEELPNTFIFRWTLCSFLLELERKRTGGRQNAKAKILRNDVVDMTFAAYGTYFDGLMTTDAIARLIHDQASRFLAELFRCDTPAARFHAPTS